MAINTHSINYMDTETLRDVWLCHSESTVTLIMTFGTQR